MSGLMVMTIRSSAHPRHPHDDDRPGYHGQADNDIAAMYDIAPAVEQSGEK
jgi:hypothetical protein